VSDDQILVEARRCFLDRGPGVSTEVIAEAVGISQPALFKRFGTKRELLISALMPRGTPEWVEEIATLPDDRSFQDQLVDIGQAVSSFFRQVSPCMSVLRASGIPPEALMERFDVPPPIAAVDVVSGWLVRCHERGLVRKTDFEAAATAILGSFHIRNFLNHISGASPLPDTQMEYFEGVAEIFAQGIATEDGE